MKTAGEISAIIQILKGLYPDALCSLQYEKDYELLFAVRLSAQCTDERVNKVTPALYERFPTLESFAEADPKEVGEYIHSCGFYNGKSRDIVACAQKLLLEHGGKVPGTMEELTALPGVGRKTANLILGDIYLCLRYALHPHHGASGPDRRIKRPGKSRAATAGSVAAGGVVEFLSPDGPLWTRHLYSPRAALYRLPALGTVRSRRDLIGFLSAHFPPRRHILP